MTKPTAKILADSIYPAGFRLTTMEVRFHRFILPQFNSHRVLSRNSASSRAIPVDRQLARLADGPAEPLSWPAEKPGMQGGAELPDPEPAQQLWNELRSSAIAAAATMRELGLHKSVANRVLEPHMWHTCVVTATAWNNFFEQRSSPLAQPEIRHLSDAMHAAYQASTPACLGEGEWHLPYIRERDRVELAAHPGPGFSALVKVSAARCARTSYLTQAGIRDVAKDLDLYARLVSAEPPHWSPLEHVATPWRENQGVGDLSFSGIDGEIRISSLAHLPRVGNLLGWRSLRTELEAARGVSTYC